MPKTGMIYGHIDVTFPGIEQKEMLHCYINR